MLTTQTIFFFGVWALGVKFYAAAGLTVAVVF
jgi:hypothetical protein